MADSVVDVARKLALQGVLKPDWDAFRRKICRWYSHEFATPLKEVEDDLDFFEVLVHYFEAHFEQLNDQDRSEQIKLAIETPEERKKREIREDLEDQEFLEMAIKEEEERLKKGLDYTALAKELKEDKLINKTDDKPEIDIKFEEKIDLDKGSF
jgi:hypothetical protein